MEAREMVSSSTGAMNSVLSKLAVLLVEESNPRTRSSIIALRYALTSMRSFLESRAASMEEIDPLVEGWMNQVREMTYDLEDCIDDFVRPAALSDTNRVAQLLKMVTWRRQYTGLLQELKERVCEASERRWRYGIVCDPGNLMPIESDDVPIDGLLPIFSAHQEGRLVCVEGPRDRLIKLLAPDDQQQLKMVSIVGSRGIGKTTLAMEVYQSLKERFHCHTVVSVSRRHDLRKILVSILSQVSMQEWDFIRCDEEQLIHKLSEFLKTKRYFIVIEDIWDVSAWKIIRWAFPENGCGSRILVTTCSTSIASPSCYFSKGDIFKMAPLSDSEARKLFFRTIFHPEYGCPSRLEMICTDILKKCGGLPLAIITIARLLAMKPDGSEWKGVRDGIASVLDKSSTLEGMKQILHFAYFDLPFQLRTCLLYLAIFPEGYVIDKARLIRRWMAEGFIIEEHGKSSEEVGECYFSDLINRGLIQPVYIQYNGQIEACQVQNMILDLILSKSDEENFVTRYDDHGCIFGLQDRIRRLSLYCDHDKEGSFIPSVITASHIRSLTIFMTDKEMPTLANFRALRVLDLEICGELENANYLINLENLHLLKYIRLQATRFIKLPEHLGKLQFLQTLDLTRALIKKLPCSIVRLKQLIYLLVKNVKLPDGIGELQVLRELAHVEVESSNPNSLEELGRLTMLRVLGLNWCISDTDACMDICANSLIFSLEKLGNSSLQSLHIRSGSGCSLDFLLDSLSSPFNHLHEFRMTSDYYFPRIPEWMTSLVSLRLLEINIDTPGEETLKILEKLPSLLVLLLSVKSAAPNQRLVIRSYGFQHLLQFDFICLNGLHMVMFEQGSMLALEKLHLKFQAKGVLVYYGFQFGIEHIASLRYLHVDIDCKDAEAREVEAAEDAVRGAISNHPGHPRLELRKLREEDVVMDEVEITVHGEGAEDHNDVESEEMVEEELISPDDAEMLKFSASSKWLVALVSGAMNRDTAFCVFYKVNGSPLKLIKNMLFIGYAYPAYECCKAIELRKPGIEQLIFWCQYWILVALVTGLGSFIDMFTISWPLFYSVAKLLFFVYLWYPGTKGITYIYGIFCRPYTLQHENGIDRSFLELGARANDVVALNFQKVATVGHSVLKYVASQSPSRKSKQRRSQESQETNPAASDYDSDHDTLETNPAASDYDSDHDTLETFKGPEQPQLQDEEIDRRAEAFIAAFYQQIRLNREASVSLIAAGRDTLKALKDLVESASVAEQDLLADASRIVDRCGTYSSTAQGLQVVADGLRALGYDAAVCKSCWDKTPLCPAGEHEYIDTMVGDEMRLIVEVNFQQHFVLAHPTKAYLAMFHVLPLVFVGTEDRLEQIMAIMVDAVQESIKKKRIQTPLWLKPEYMRAKWLSPHVRIDRSNELSAKKESAEIKVMRV